MSDARLLTVHAPDGQPIDVVVRDRLSIGRAGRGLIVHDERVSRRHCEFRLDDGVLTVTDLSSANGTTVDGRPLTGDPEPVATGAVVQLGRTTILVGPTVLIGDDPTPVTDAPSGSVDGSGPAAGEQPDEQPATEGAVAVPRLGASVDQLRASIVGSTLTLVFSDIVDSTTLVTRHGDVAWFAHLRRHDQLTRAQLARFHGTEIKGQGDGFLMTFPSARHALLFCIALQSALRDERSTRPDFPIHVRLGAHTGEVVQAAGDVFGRHVHRAARIAALAGADEIVTSALVRELTESMGDLRFGPPRTVGLKGFDEPQVVHRVAWNR